MVKKAMIQMICVVSDGTSRLSAASHG